MKFVIAIDDNPERYDQLSMLLQEDGITLVCMQNPHAVSMFLATNAEVVHVLLDYDMPHVNEDYEIFQEWNGTYYLKEVLPTKIPVTITSANTISGPKLQVLGESLGFNIRRYSVLWSNAVNAWRAIISNNLSQ